MQNQDWEQKYLSCTSQEKLLLQCMAMAHQRMTYEQIEVCLQLLNNSPSKKSDDHKLFSNTTKSAIKAVMKSLRNSELVGTTFDRHFVVDADRVMNQLQQSPSFAKVLFGAVSVGLARSDVWWQNDDEPAGLRTLNALIYFGDIFGVSDDEIEQILSDCQIADKVELYWRAFGNVNCVETFSRQDDLIFGDAISYVIDGYSDLCKKLPDDLFPLAEKRLKNQKQAIRDRCYVSYLSYLLLRGDINKAVTLIEEKKLDRGEELAWSCFLKGDDQTASKLFELALKRERKKQGTRTIIFTGYAALFYALQIIRHPDPKKPNSLKTAINQFEKIRSYKDIKLLSCFEALRQIEGLKTNRLDDIDYFWTRFEDKDERPAPLQCVVYALVSYWCYASVKSNVLDMIKEIETNSAESGFFWIQMVCCEILAKTVQSDSKKYERKASKIKGTHGFASILDIFAYIPPWKRSLKALCELQNNSSEKEIQEQKRVAWLIKDLGGMSRLDLQCREQKILKNGQWSKGTAPAIAKILDGELATSLTKEDEKIIGFLRGHHFYQYGRSFFIDDAAGALLALSGHPFVFFESDMQTPIEIQSDVPQLIVDKMTGSKQESYYIHLNCNPNESFSLIEQEGVNQLKVIKITDEAKKLYSIIGESGLTVPAEGLAEVQETVKAISRSITVHSSLNDGVEGVNTVEASTIPHFLLTPYGKGLRQSLKVRPFGEVGPFYSPGMGRNRVICEIDGKRIQTTRNFSDEIEKARVVLEMIAHDDSLYVDLEEVYEESGHCLHLVMALQELVERNLAVVEWPEGKSIKIKNVTESQLSLSFSTNNEWLSLEGEIQIDEETVVSMARFLQLIASSEGQFIQVKEGFFINIADHFRKNLKDLHAFSQSDGTNLLIHPLVLLGSSDIIDNLKNGKFDSSFKKRRKELEKVFAAKSKVPSTFTGELRDYQQEGFVWMMRLLSAGIGVCLADDMGLGKTIQALAVLIEKAQQGPSLVLAPTSVCHNWVREMAKFAPTLNPVVLNGVNRKKQIASLGPHDVCIMSYTLAVNTLKYLEKQSWGTLVLDEAQAIKNNRTKRAHSAKLIPAKNKLALTGTPIENHLSELWSLFDFLNPGLLGSHKQFEDRFTIPIEKHALKPVRQQLKRLVQPFILRRLKGDVLDELPEKSEISIPVQLSKEEIAFYEALRQKAVNNLSESDTKSQFKIFAEIMKLRRAACHPKLANPDVDIRSSKLEACMQLIEEILAGGHKALIFSQFVGHLTIVRAELDQREIAYMYLDGRTTPKQREKRVADFQAGSKELFLISLKAGGLGLNLTAADYVIHLDPWWNPAVEDQASDRSHRIGQKRPVTVYRLISQNTIEEKIVRLHSKKRDLADSLLEGTARSAKLSSKELVELINEGQ